jgi:dATP pyrophosphohydrolase
MSRAPFQVIVFLYRFLETSKIEYAIFFRRTELYGDFWQAISGGGEDGETPLQAARRELREESGLDPNAEFMQLDMMAMLPADAAVGEMLWGEEVLAIPEYAFGAHITEGEITLSREHEEYRWLDYASAYELLKWDSNCNALWELNYRLVK